MTDRFSFMDFIFLVFFLSLTFSPFLMIYAWRVPRDVEIDPEFINGLIAVSGILLGFVSAIVATGERLPPLIYIMALANWALLWYAATSVFECSLGQTPPIDAAKWTMCSLTSNHITVAGIIVLRFFPRR